MCSGSFRMKARTPASVASVVPSFKVIGRASFADHRRLAFTDIGAKSNRRSGSPLVRCVGAAVRPERVDLAPHQQGSI
jgi:hypothetical protein